jgi:DNA-binding winged helix-turn-helix (wHTH) protein
VRVRFRIGTFTLDLETRRLTEGERVVHLTPKAFDLLAALVLERPKVLSKADLQQRLWADTFVVDANLSNLVAEIREALGDQARDPRFIRTAHGVGYAFSGEARPLPDRAAPVDTPPACWLDWDGRRFPLSTGENILGRDPDAEVCLDASTVSRRHARIVVSADAAMLEDFGSKNGTAHGGTPVTAPTRLADGDTITVGSVVVTFHTRAGLGSTETQVN